MMIRMGKDDHLLTSHPQKKYQAIVEADLCFETPPENVPLRSSFRLGVSVCCMFLTTFITCQQESMTTAIVIMMPDNQTGWRAPASNWTSGSGMPPRPNPDWSHKTEGWIVSIFFFGYFIIQLPSGYLVSVYGPKAMALFGLLASSLLQIITVFACFQGSYWVLAARFLTGVNTGLMYGSSFDLIARWTPRHETSMLYGVVGSGLELGPPLCFILSFISSQINVQGGWPFIFYFQGVFGVICFIIFAIILSDSPLNNRFTTWKESNYIELTRAPRKIAKRIPVFSIMRSPVVWAMLISQLGTDWMAYSVMTQFPLYHALIIGLTETEVNTLGSAPMFLVVLFIILSGYVADYCIRKKLLTRTCTRKLFDTMAKLLSAVVCIGMCFLPDGSFGIAFLFNVLIAAALGFTCGGGYLPNQGEVGPCYTAFICGFCQTGAMWVGVAVPIFWGDFTVNNSVGGWQICFLVTAILQIVTCLFFTIFGSGELQPWAVDNDLKMLSP